MATNYPVSLDSGTQQPSPSASTVMDDTGFEHDVVHTNHSGAIIALETKVGTAASTAVTNSVLAGTGTGTSGWTTGPTVASCTVVGDLTVDTNTLLVDSTNNKVGIGKTPSSMLDVNGQIQAYQNTLQTTNDDYSFITSGNFGGGYGFYEGLNRAVMVSPGGNQWELHVGGTATSWGTKAIAVSSAGAVTIPVSLNGVDPDNFANMTDSSGAGRKISVHATAPTSPTTGDVWIDIS